MVVMFADTLFDHISFIAIILLAADWWRGYCYFKTIRGELAIFYDLDELYWSKQRWSIVKKPLFLKYAVVIHLRSKRNNKNRVLFLMDDSLSHQDWRNLHYFLRQFVLI